MEKLALCGFCKGELPGAQVADKSDELGPVGDVDGADTTPYARSVEERFERQARNEALMRAVNEQIAELSGSAGVWADSDHQFAFLCECGQAEECESRVVMSRTAYERVRAQRDRFAVAPGHQTSEIEVVVEEGDNYLIVDKKDRYEPLVE